MIVGEPHQVSPLTLRADEAGIPRPWFVVIEGARLLKLRREAGLSQKRLAERAGVSIKAGKVNNGVANC